MARPRLLRDKDGGEITLKNVSQETYDKIKQLVEGKEEVAPAETGGTPTGVCSNVALGTYSVDGVRYGFATIKYNPETKEAFVEDTKVFESKGGAIDEFKIVAVSKNLV